MKKYLFLLFILFSCGVDTPKVDKGRILGTEFDPNKGNAHGDRH